jgi:hypothetical protein
MFCTNCGQLHTGGDIFCTKCGLSFPIESPTSGNTSNSVSLPLSRCPNPDCNKYIEAGASFCTEAGCGTRLITPDFPDVPQISSRTVLLALRRVKINRAISEAGDRAKFEVPWILVTRESIIFLDESREGFFMYRVRVGRRGRNVQYYLCPFWVLRKSLNDALDHEFKNAPKEFSKPREVWWVEGYRHWDWVSGPITPRDELTLRVPLALVMAFSQWGPGQQTPITRMDQLALVTFSTTGQARAFLEVVNEATDSVAASGNPVTDDYIAKHPPKPLAGLARSYYYAFWTCLTAAIVLGILAAILPLWAAVPLAVACAALVIPFLRQWEKRTNRNKEPK